MVQHVVLLLDYAITRLVDPVPKEVRDHMKREAYFLKRRQSSMVRL